MMVKAVSRKYFEGICREHGFTDANMPNDMFFICIHNTNGENSTPYFKQDHPNVLKLAFDDCSQDETGTLLSGEPYTQKAMTKEQAEIIYDFLIAQKQNGVQKGLLHCSAGISRSGAVVTFAADVLEVDQSAFKKMNQYIRPNPHVMSLLNGILWEQIWKND